MVVSCPRENCWSFPWRTVQSPCWMANPSPKIICVGEIVYMFVKPQMRQLHKTPQLSLKRDCVKVCSVISLCERLSCLACRSEGGLFTHHWWWHCLTALTFDVAWHVVLTSLLRTRVGLGVTKGAVPPIVGYWGLVNSFCFDNPITTLAMNHLENLESYLAFSVLRVRQFQTSVPWWTQLRLWMGAAMWQSHFVTQTQWIRCTVCQVWSNMQWWRAWTGS